MEYLLFSAWSLFMVIVCVKIWKAHRDLHSFLSKEDSLL